MGACDVVFNEDDAFDSNVNSLRDGVREVNLEELANTCNAPACLNVTSSLKYSHEDADLIHLDKIERLASQFQHHFCRLRIASTLIYPDIDLRET
jgi:hypothetical protein